MVTPDRRKLTALLLAQAGAFVVVLGIGGFTGHHTGGKQPARQPSPAGHISIGPSGHTPAPSTELTVEVSQAGGFGVAMPPVPLEILKDPAMTLVVSAKLAAAVTGMELVRSVPAGDYQVCVNPPHGWTFTDRSTGALPGWDCAKVEARSRAQIVTFHLTLQSPETGTVPS